MRYLFRGLVRETGKLVEGHVEAASPDVAMNVLSENGIITESLREDPKPLKQSPTPVPAPEFADAIDSALDSSSMQVAFDDLMDRYRGKRVWVIDRDKIRHRVAQVVDKAMTLSQERAESAVETRKRVQDAISGMFQDNRNIASEAANPAAALAGSPGASGIDEQISRLDMVVKQAEVALAMIQAAARRVGYAGGAPRRESFHSEVADEPKREVLLEIFKTNLELQRGVEIGDGAQTDGQMDGQMTDASPSSPVSAEP